MNHSDFTPLLITQHNEYDHKTLYCLFCLRPWGIQAIKFITSTSLVLLMMNLTPAEKSKSFM